MSNPSEPAMPPAPARRKPGHRARRPARRRAPQLRGALFVTSASALLPGVGYLYSGRKVLGWLVLVPCVLLAGWALLFSRHDLAAALDFAFDPARLKTAAVLLGIGLLLWLFVVVTTYLMVRPLHVPPWKAWTGGAFVVVLCLAVAAPVTMAAKYAMVQADLVETVFKEEPKSATTPQQVTEADPWGGRGRVNVLLLGGDGGDGRIGVRTDSMILASIDTETGKTVTFSLPRNMMNAPFPKRSPLHDLYPYGFGGEGDPGNWMLNAVYREVPLLHPKVLGESDNEGADALKQAVQATTGLRVDYYVLVNLEGFRKLVDAMGGVTVNINTPVAIGGNSTLGIEPDDWLEPGPDQHLDGFQALWFSRGRYGADDYQRMDRQRCMIDAIIDEADPLTLIRRYQALAAAGKELVVTDIPRDLVPAFVELGLKVKDKRVKSVVFRSSDDFYPGDPDFDYVRETVATALEKHPGGGKKGNKAEEDNKDACAYQPTG